MVRILFVCLGNICRSPTAEGVFRDLVRRDGLADRIETDSCGTGAWHVGDPPDPRARGEARRRGIDLEDLRARAVRSEDFAAFDYILAMDRRNLSDLMAICPQAHTDKVRLFLSFLPERKKIEVPDPYYGGPDGFSDVFDLVTAGAEALLNHIRATHLSGRP